LASRWISGEFALPYRATLAAETAFRAERTAADAKVSRGAFGGQYFRTSASESVAHNVRKTRTIAAKTEQLALFDAANSEDQQVLNKRDAI